MNRRNSRDSQTSYDSGNNAPEPYGSDTTDIASTASYIAEMTAELASLAAQAQLPMLTYFLNLARVEAEMRARTLANDMARAEAEKIRRTRRS